MGSFSKGWSDVLLLGSQNQGPSSAPDELTLGHVISVDYTESYGKIKVRVINKPHQGAIDDDDLLTEAYPGNVNMIKYPLPGELVLLIPSPVKDVNFFYITTITTGHDILYNSNSSMLVGVPTKLVDKIFKPSFKERFKKNFINIDKFVQTNGKLRERGPMYPTEGDFIIQGRFGGAMRFGSTGNKHSWSDKKGSFSNVGDPILAISAHRRDTTRSVYENINLDDSSFYFCSTQKVKVDLATSANLYSHRHKYDIKTKFERDKDLAKFVDTDFRPQQYPPSPPMPLDGSSGGGTMNLSGMDPDAALARSYNFRKIPDSKNNYRSAQLPLESFPTVIQTYGIKHVIRFNGSDGDDARNHETDIPVSHKQENDICTQYQVTWHHLSAGSGYQVGLGPVKAVKASTAILLQGNTLIHCAHGADRTGGHVGSYLKTTGVMTDRDQLWEYTTKYNGWNGYIEDGRWWTDKYHSYRELAEAIYPMKDLILSKWVQPYKDKIPVGFVQKA